MTGFGLYALALGTGAAAGLSPCGVGMLPSYVGLLVGTDQEEARAVRGLGAGLAVSAGFLALFVTTAVAIMLAASSVIHLIPWLAVAVGAGLLIWGVVGLVSGHLGGVELRGTRLFGYAPGEGRGGLFGYGVAYGVACLSCSLPLFLSLVVQSLASRSAAQAGLVLLAYGLGLSIVVNVLTVLTVTARHTAHLWIRRVTPYVERFGSVLVLASGAYLLWYWLAGPSGLFSGNAL